MSKYRVKEGHHFVNGKLHVAGDIVDVDNKKFAEGDRAAFFEKVTDESEKTGEAGKRGGKKTKGAEAPNEEGAAPAAATGEGEGETKEAAGADKE